MGGADPSSLLIDGLETGSVPEPSSGAGTWGIEQRPVLTDRVHAMGRGRALFDWADPDPGWYLTRRLLPEPGTLRMLE